MMMMMMMMMMHVHQQIQTLVSETWQVRPSEPRSLDAHHVCWWIPGCARSLFAAHRRRVAEQAGFLSLCSHRSRNHPHEDKQKAAETFTHLIRQTYTNGYKLLQIHRLLCTLNIMFRVECKLRPVCDVKVRLGVTMGSEAPGLVVGQLPPI